MVAIGVVGMQHPLIAAVAQDREVRVRVDQLDPQDLPLEGDRSLDIANQDRRTAVDGVTDDAMERLIEYDWPGNVREMENMIERVVVLHNGSRVLPRR